MRKLISWLSRSAVLRRAVQLLRLHRLANAWLRRFPMVKRLPGSGILYRATRVESIPLAQEMFEKGALYDASLLPKDFTTFVDLGCNVGYFTCWLAHLARVSIVNPKDRENTKDNLSSHNPEPEPCSSGRQSAPSAVGEKFEPTHVVGHDSEVQRAASSGDWRVSTGASKPTREGACAPLKGLMIDANPYAVGDAQWHAAANGMPEVFGIHGIVGEGQAGGSATFYLYESNICSTSELPDVEKLGLKGRWEKISVPHVTVEAEWKRRFGDARCHVLKIDVEGSEMNFLRAEQRFLALVDCIIIEWHKWRVSLADVRQFLEQAGFRFVKTIEENEQMGTAVFKRTT